MVVLSPAEILDRLFTRNLELPFGGDLNTSQWLPYQSGPQTLSVHCVVRLIASLFLDLI